MQNKQELQMLVSQFLRLMNSVKDDPESASEVTKFLQTILRTKQVTPPTTEFMTVLKHEKPRMFHSMRYRTNRSSHFYILFQLQTDYTEAKEKLEAIVKG